jgi:hypothetical protein
VAQWPSLNTDETTRDLTDVASCLNTDDKAYVAGVLGKRGTLGRFVSVPHISYCIVSLLVLLARSGIVPGSRIAHHVCPNLATERVDDLDWHESRR